MTFPVRRGVPSISTADMREVDRVMEEDLGIGLAQMMENAGRDLALLAGRRFDPDRVTVLAGPGGNGGGGIVAARHLANRGVDVTIALVRTDLDGVPARQADIARRMGIPFTAAPGDADLVVDAVIGYSISGDPRGRAADLIGWANEQTAPVLALDTPSGLDLTMGSAGEPTVEATATLTLALPKRGLRERPDLVGELYLGDISVPPSVYRAFGIALDDPFADGPVVRVDPPDAAPTPRAER
ncbi:MAG: NAD(P)H-hydrate epimerase [Acidimicrobiia bacterium]|nr:NAD(P)H-hydrate epimerase [Acidimicrobiia bacterium]